MSEVIQKYGVEFEFVDNVTKKLNQYQQKMNRFSQTMSRQMSTSSGTMQGGHGIRASKTTLADMLRDEDKLAKAAERVSMAERKRVVELRKAKSSLKDNALWMKSELSTVEQLTQKRIRERVASARTARQVRAIVNSEMKRLSVMRQEERSLKRQSFLLNRMQTSSKQFAGNMVSAFAIAAGAGAIVRTGQDLEAVSNTMLAVSKNSEEAGKNLSFVKDEAFRLGLGLTESSRGFAKLVAARGDMSLEDTKQAFLGVAEMSTLLGLSAAESSRALTALQQMASKSVVSAEEFNLGSLLRNR